ncbi:MAG: bifunctional phosphopantothenoylcysteine decarboxylase/phosphopantothenate--cysteine ligase CoaBC, partial [Bacteroidaceae bacterium]
WADLMLIAPATASTLGKMANGVADNMLITTYLSVKAPVFIAPAMDLDMYRHPSTKRNLKQLREYGNHIIEPTEGELASKLMGKGRMEEPENIVAILERFFAENKNLNTEFDVLGNSKTDLLGQRILITAGPTYEKIDPVRFIGNYSSGKMGFALAEECAKRGAEVILVAGPVELSVSHPSIQRIDVECAEEMYQVAVSEYPQCNAAILCAAVADFTPECASEQKIKREKEDLLIRLKPTHDIAANLGRMKRPDQVLVGFALETHEEIAHAKEKLQRKNFDFIVLNSLQNKGAGFRYDTNQITILSVDEKLDFPLKLKQEVAVDIVDALSKRIN